MAQKLPYSRVIDVTVTRQDRFATAQGFSVMLIIGTEVKAGILDAEHRTKVYGSMQEIATDWGADSEFYKAGMRVFQRNPSPRQIKFGYRDATKSILDEMDAIYAQDSDWYWLTATKELADTPEQMERLLSRVPLGRLAQPNDVATAVCYLASEEAGFVTGLLLDVNGGMYMG